MWDGAEDYIFNKPPQPTLGFSTFSLPHPKPRELHRGDSREGRGNSPWQFRLLPHCCKSGCPRMTDQPTPVREGDLLPEGVGPAGRAVSIHQNPWIPSPRCIPPQKCNANQLQSQVESLAKVQDFRQSSKVTWNIAPIPSLLATLTSSREAES